MSTRHRESVPTISSPEEFVEAIPCLLGFHPSDSLVVVVVTRRSVSLTARCDIALSDRPEEYDRFVRTVTHDWQGSRLPQIQVFVAGYSDRQTASAAVRALQARLDAQVLGAVVVDHDRWWMIDDDIHGPGRLVLRDTGLSRRLTCGPVAASRSDLAASIAAPMGQREDDMLRALVDALDQVKEDDPVEAGLTVVALMSSWHDGTALSDRDYLTAAVAMSLDEARHEVWKVLSASKARQYLHFWKEVVSRTPQGIRTVVLAVTGMFAWIAGEGVLMNVCLEEAEQADSEYPLVRMLSRIARCGVPPSTWAQMKP
ncbi:MAG: DUF4192 domain-containing protein [Propionibacteriaceae bacterium]|nr:DUF4192 domain-containing protein [Propionibacteriaceae bacterium]